MKPAFLLATKCLLLCSVSSTFGSVSSTFGSVSSTSGSVSSTSGSVSSTSGRSSGRSSSVSSRCGRSSSVSSRCGRSSRSRSSRSRSSSRGFSRRFGFAACSQRQSSDQRGEQSSVFHLFSLFLVCKTKPKSEIGQTLFRSPTDREIIATWKNNTSPFLWFFKGLQRLQGCIGGHFMTSKPRRGLC